MGAKSLLAIAGVAVVTLLLLVYLAATYEPPQGTTTIVVPPPVVEASPTPARVIPSAPVIAQPVAEPEPPVAVVETTPTPVTAPVVEVVQLPSLGDSDGFLMERLRAIQNGAALLGMLTDTQLIRSLVVFVDNVSKGEIPDTNLPYRAIQQEMPVRNIDDNLFVMDEAAHHRFDRVIDTLLAVDTEQAMGLYRILSPLFQQAYAEIGYRDVNFDNTLRRAINVVLQYDEVEGPFQLVKPSVMYLYADASIESLQEVQKQLIRLGPENTEKLKGKLRDVLQLL
ncbi:MAG: hypothetical protein RLZZ385_2480 [Pseudomonadota bacterium]|jgi:hypothetical protein